MQSIWHTRSCADRGMVLADSAREDQHAGTVEVHAAHRGSHEEPYSLWRLPLCQERKASS